MNTRMMEKQGGLMAFSYNLLTEPWLPCKTNDNQLQNLSLLDTILKAHQIRTIHAHMPIMTGSLYLFLIAFVKSIFRPENDNDWEKLWKTGKFPEKDVLDYAKKWANKFDLFNPDQPFYQDPKFGIREKDQKRLNGKPLTAKPFTGFLEHFVLASLFNHLSDTKSTNYDPSYCAQLLIMIQAYSLHGMSLASVTNDKYYKASPFVQGITFLNKGDNIFETLVLNMIPINFDSLLKSDTDRPCWETDDVFQEDQSTPHGLLDLLTWQSRRILLLPEQSDNGIYVSSIYSAPGLVMVDTFNNPFFYIQLVKNKKKDYFRKIKYQQEKSLWRESSVFLDVHSKYSSAPITLDWISHLKFFNIVSRNLLLMETFGMCVKPGVDKKIYFYRHEEFHTPIDYLTDAELFNSFRDKLNLAESDIKYALNRALWNLASFKLEPNHDQEGSKTPDSKDVRSLIQHWNAESHYWNKLEFPFYEFLYTLPKSEQAYDLWDQALKKAARDALEHAISQVGTDPAGLKASAKAELTLNYQLKKLFNPPEEE